MLSVGMESKKAFLRSLAWAEFPAKGPEYAAWPGLAETLKLTNWKTLEKTWVQVKPVPARQDANPLRVAFG